MVSLSLALTASAVTKNTVTKAAATLTASVSSLNYTSVVPGKVSSSQVVTISNPGPSPVAITSAVTLNPEFKVTQQCSSVPARSSCNVAVAFAPTTVEALTSALSISYGGSSTPLAVSLAGVTATTTSSNAIYLENQKPGSAGWAISSKSTGQVEGYASATSVNRGGSVSLYINSSLPNVRVDVYRMGWYGGAGGRLMSSATLQGMVQVLPVADPTTGLIECNWVTQYTLNVPRNTSDLTDWMSGVYMIQLTASRSTKSYQSYIPLVVRDDQRSSDILMVSPVTTYQAYNNWGGKSLYASLNPDGVAAQKVSFNRPYANNNGSGEFMLFEYNMVRFLERESYDVTYATSLDLHEQPQILATHKAFLSASHDEYWSWEMRQTVQQARDKGVNLAFWASNNCWWQIRFEPSTLNGSLDRNIVAYKSLASKLDPYALDSDKSNDYLITGNWGRPGTPTQESLIGIGGASGRIGSPISLNIVSTASALFNGTGLAAGDSLPMLVAGEVDSKSANSPANLQVLADTPVPNTTLHSQVTTYVAPSGALVFAGGSYYLVNGLDSWSSDMGNFVQPSIQQLGRNLFNRMTGH